MQADNHAHVEIHPYALMLPHLVDSQDTLVRYQSDFTRCVFRSGNQSLWYQSVSEEDSLRASCFFLSRVAKL